MRIKRARCAAIPVLLVAASILASVIAVRAASTSKPAGAGAGASAAEARPPAPPEVNDTATNLQIAFGLEVNDRERYAALARQADRDGYPAVARLFRACGRAEAAHADRVVTAIAWTSDDGARAVLERVVSGTTVENLKAAVERERYQAEQFYPPRIARARAENRTEAVRSLTFACSAEREHLRLLTAALEGIGQPAADRPLYVCPTCGKTVEGLGFRRCPNCFTPAGRFVRVT